MLSKKELALITLFFIIWRVTLFGLSFFADSFLLYQPSFPYFDTILLSTHLPRWLFSWANFDGVHYLTIAAEGYVGFGLVQAFFPLFPYIILGFLHLTFGSSLISLAGGLVLTNVFSLLLAWVWYAFVKEFFDKDKAWLAVLLLFLFPTAFFLGALYTESLFLLLVISSFYTARKGWWFRASLFAMLAAATRVVGIFLIPALLIELALQFYEKQSQQKKKIILSVELIKSFFQKSLPQAVLILCSSVGLLSYMFFLQQEFKDPLYFLHVQADFGAGRQEGFITYPQTWWRSLKTLLTFRPFNWRYFTVVNEFLAGTLGLPLLVLAAKYVRPSWVFFGLGVFLLPTLTGNFLSMPRFLLVCFPIFLVLVHFLPKKSLITLCFLGILCILLLINTVLFIQGYWVS